MLIISFIWIPFLSNDNCWKDKGNHEKYKRVLFLFLWKKYRKEEVQKKVSLLVRFFLFLETNIRANIIRFYWLNFASCGDLYLFIKYPFSILSSSSFTLYFNHLRFSYFDWPCFLFSYEHREVEWVTVLQCMTNTSIQILSSVLLIQFEKRHEIKAT